MNTAPTAVRCFHQAALLVLLIAPCLSTRADTSFTGAVDNDWLVTGNWSDGPPAPDVAAQISVASTVLSGGPEQNIGNLSISAGQAATVQGGAVLTGSGLGIAAGSLIVDGVGTVVSFGGDDNIQLGVAGTGSPPFPTAHCSMRWQAPERSSSVLPAARAQSTSAAVAFSRPGNWSVSQRERSPSTAAFFKPVSAVQMSSRTLPQATSRSSRTVP